MFHSISHFFVWFTFSYPLTFVLLYCDVSNVRVSDTSAFGEQVDANPSATIFALTEKLSDIIRQEYRYVSSIEGDKLLGKRRPRAVAQGATISRDTMHKLKDYSQIFPQTA